MGDRDHRSVLEDQLGRLGVEVVARRLVGQASSLGRIAWMSSKPAPNCGDAPLPKWKSRKFVASGWSAPHPSR